MIKKLKSILPQDGNLIELLKGSATTFIIRIIGMLISYLVIFLIARKYGDNGVGLYSLTYRIINSLALIGALGFNVSVLRYVGQFNDPSSGAFKKKKMFTFFSKVSFSFSVLLAIGLYYFSERIALDIFDNEAYTDAILVAAIALPFFTINLISVEFIRGLKLLRVSEYLRSINTPLIVITCLVLAVFNLGVLGAVYALTIGLILSSFFSVLFIINYFRKIKIKEDELDPFSRLEFIKTSMPMMVTTISSFVLAYAGSFYLEAYSTTDNVGVFNVCLTLAQFVSLVLIVVNTISAPKFSELYWSNQQDNLKKVIHQSSKLIFWGSIFVSIVLIIFSKSILGLFGNEFVVGYKVLIVIIIGQIVNSMTGSVGVFLNMTGNQKLLQKVILITTVIVLVAYFIIVPIYGMLGAAIVYMSGTVILNISLAILAYKRLNVITFYLPFFNRIKK